MNTSKHLGLVIHEYFVTFYRPNRFDIYIYFHALLEHHIEKLIIVQNVANDIF